MYKIITDSCANLTNEIINKYSLDVISMTYIIDGKEYKSYEKGKDNNLQEFYAKMREKQKASTCAVNEEEYYEAFDNILKEGYDLLYIGFSSSLSCMFNNCLNAVAKLKEKYPKQKIIAVDSLCASMGQGLMVYHCLQLQEAGKSLEEVALWVEKNKLSLAHWFTVDDLYYLYNGGRIGKISYIVGSIAKIKPVLHMDNEGKLVACGKVLGRKRSILTLCDNICESLVEPENQTLFVAHCDCEEDAQFVKERLLERIKCKEIIVGFIDPVIGVHSGPGTLAVFGLCSKR